MRFPLSVAAVFLALPLSAQVEIKQADESLQGIEVPCPMEITVPLTVGLSSKPFRDYEKQVPWTNAEMSSHFCHTERIARVMVTKKKLSRSKVVLEVSTVVQSEQWRQDVDLKVDLYAPGSGRVCGHRWPNLTVGKDRAISSVTWVTMASKTKTPSFECEIDRKRFDSWFAGDQAPFLRIHLEPERD